MKKLSTLSKETLEPVIKSLIDKHKTNFKGSWSTFKNSSSWI